MMEKLKIREGELRKEQKERDKFTMDRQNRMKLIKDKQFFI
jgi:hypothetical protein